MFELTISKQALITPLLTVAGAVDKKQSLPVLGNILLTLTPEFLQLSATDLEIEIRSFVTCSSSSETGKITVPAKKMVDIIRSLDDSAMPTLSYSEGIVTIKEGRSKFKLATLSAENYPTTDIEISDFEFTMQKSSLIQLLQSTHFAMSQQDVRIFLNGLLLEIESGKLTAVATDGHRMAICRYPTIAQNQCRLLLPRKGVQELLRILNSINDEEILVSAGKNHITVKTSQYVFSSKLIEARFPPYAKAIPLAQDKHVVIDRDILKRSLSRIIILANEKSRAVVLHLQDNQLTLIANNQEQEEATDVLETLTEGEEIKIGINASYLLDVLSFLPEGEMRLSMSNSESSILVESPANPNYQYIIMPMKI